MRSIQCLKLLRCQCQGQSDGVLLYMRYGTRFGNCNGVTAADGPGQRNSGCRATVCCTNTCKHRIAQQAGAGAAEWRIGHHRHAVLLAPRQQVMFNAAVADVVRDLISRAAIALSNTEQVFQVSDLEVGHAPGANLPCRAQIFKSLHDAGEVGDPIWPVQQIEIEMIRTETSEAASQARAMPFPATWLGHT
jgi:hypothetical protein